MFYLGNVVRCKKENIEAHLKENGITFSNIFPLFRKSPKNSKNNKDKKDSTMEVSDQTRDKQTKTTAFKKILPVSEVNKLLDNNIWYDSTYIKEWDFDKSPMPKKVTTKNGE